jgi:hypothetical protein
MAQEFVNGIEGTLDADLTTGSTTMSGTFLADLPEVTTEFVVLVIDPDEVSGTFEVVHVTAHTAAATTCTVLREQESTTETAPWPSGTKVVASLTAQAIVTSVTAGSTAQATADAAATQIDFDAHDGGTDVADHPEATPSVRGFMSAADKTKLDTVEQNASDLQTPAELLTALLGVDGTGTLLDADLLDGQEGTYYLNLDNMTAGEITSGQLPSSAIEKADLLATLTSTLDYKGLNSLGAKALNEQKYGHESDADAFAGRRIFIQSATPTMSDGDIWFDTTP